MSLDYRANWTVQNPRLGLRDLRWASFSHDGSRVATGNGKYIFILSAADGVVQTRISYEVSPVAIQWLSASLTLIAAYHNGTIVNVSFRSRLVTFQALFSPSTC